MLFSHGFLKSNQFLWLALACSVAAFGSEPDEMSEIKGFSNTITMIEEQGKKVILRKLDDPVPHRHFLQIVKWYQKASEDHITPPLLAVDILHQTLKVEFQDHVSWPTFHDNPKIYEETMTLLKRWHHLFPIPRKVGGYQPFSMIQKQYDELSKFMLFPSQLEQVVLKMESLIDKVMEEGKEYAVICHGDFHKGNVLLAPYAEGLRPFLIDFDDACVGHPFYDICKFSLMMKEDQQLHLLRQYLERDPTKMEEAHFQMVHVCVLLSVTFNRLKKVTERDAFEEGYSKEEMEWLLDNPQNIPSLDSIPFNDERKIARQLGALAALSKAMALMDKPVFEEMKETLLKSTLDKRKYGNL